MSKRNDPRLARFNLRGYNIPKRTPKHPTKSHVVLAKQGSKVKLIRFGQQGVRGAGKNPRNAKNIAKGRMSAAYWSNKVKW